jgi:serine/threonine-protein kinase
MTDSDNDPLSTGAGLGILGQLTAADEHSLIGRELDGYRITEFIAEGGMSRVYRAERSDGSFERDVAIKVSAVSGFSPAMRERFMQEQSVLAGLNHAHISQLYDARVTDEGWPYIVMELVDGRPVTDFSEERSLSLDERLRLLIDVVDAVAYAHANLVVHRDIKPSNVLVTGDGRVKLLDFGIAKLLEGESAELTRAGAMTPRYASPEQLLGKPVSIASDIYQLGMLMAEVLTGRLPNADEALADAIRRSAEGRALSLADEVRRTLPGELVLIVEQCLRVDPGERYRDANALRDDLQAYLSGYPVSAVGQRTGYRIRKFVRRNTPAVVVSAIAIVAIVTGSIAYTVSVNEARRIAEAERDEADRQAEIARESLDFLTTVLNSADPNVAQRGSMTIREVLDKGVERIATELDDQPEIQSRLYLDLSGTYQNLGDRETQQRLIDLAEAPTLAAYGEASEQYLRLKLARGAKYYASGDYAHGKAYFEELIEEASTVLGADHRLTMHCRAQLGSNLWGLGDMQGFAETSAENLRHADESLGSGDPFTLNAAHNLAIATVNQGKLDEAVALASKYANIAEEAIGPGHTTTLSLLSILASAHGYNGDLDEELQLRRTIIDREILARGEQHPQVASAKVNLAYVYNDLGEFGEVERLFSDAVDIWTASHGADNPVTLRGRRNLAVFQARHGLDPDAVRDLEEVIALQIEKLGMEHPNTIESRLHRAEMMLRADSPDADAEIAAMSELGDRILGESSPIMQRFRQAIAEIREERDSADAAGPD